MSIDKSNADGKLEDIVDYMDEKRETTVEFNGKTFWFEYKNSIPKRVINNMKVKHADTSNVDNLEDVQLKAGDLQIALLEAHITDSSVDKISTFLKKAPQEIIDPLAEDVLEAEKEGN